MPLLKKAKDKMEESHDSSTYDCFDEVLCLDPRCMRHNPETVFRSIPVQPGGYNPHIQIDDPEYLISEKIVTYLNLLSCWGGNTSNSPAEYSHWEFPHDGEHWKRACKFLEENGWTSK